MNILLAGSTGYLGSYLSSNLVVDTFPKKNNYDYVINCVGKPDLEFCEANPEVSFRSNCLYVNELAENFPMAKMIHFSSYYVYDDDGLCSENSNTTLKYNYCKHKILSERIVQNNGGVVFRLGKLFGALNQNKLTEVLFNSKKIVLDDVFFNPTSLRQVLRAILYEIENKALFGIFNLANDGAVSHYEYGQFIKKHHNHELSISRIEKHKRGFHNYGKFLMSTDKISKFINLVNWRDDLKSYIGEIKCIA